MKLIDILVEELPKHGGWPEGVAAITQDSDKAINNYKTADGLKTNESGTWKFSSAWDSYLLRHSDAPCLASDYDTAIITREQYEAALAAKNEGWIEWGGGECPVPCGTAVDVKHRCGAVSENQQAWPKHHKESDVVVNPFSNAGQAFWRHENSVVDIIAYRPHQPKEAEHSEESEEGLNECIGQAPALLWNGEGLIPPVGCRCERSHAGDDAWSPCEILFVGRDLIVVRVESPGAEEVYDINSVTFRPIRSEADKRREESKHTIAELCRSASSNGHAADLIYDAIAAGKVRA